MKTIPMNNFYYVLITTLIYLSSCDKKKDETPIPAPELKGCQLTRIDGPFNSFVDIEYNSRGYITKSIRKEGPQAVLFRTTEYLYNANNQLIRENYFDNNDQLSYYQTYDYNTNGTVRQMSQYFNSNLALTETYTYDSNKRLTQRISTGGANAPKTSFQYLSNSHNIGVKTEYDLDNRIISTTTYGNYDNSFNPLLAVKGWVIIGESRNNPLKATSNYRFGNNNLVFTYQYNRSGLVTEQIEKTEGQSGQYQTVYTYTGCN